MSKSFLDLASEYLEKQSEPVGFQKLFDYAVQQSGITKEEAEKKISLFYTNLLLDGRFVTLGENTWDLRSRHKFDKVHIDMKDVYSDVETADIDVEEEVEEKAYNGVFDETKNDRDDQSRAGLEEDVDTL